MALDPNKHKDFQNKIDDIIEQAPVGEGNREYIKNKIFGEAFAEVSNLVGESRPPRMYIFGRSGAGKSSLINALANKEVAEVGAVEPTTVESEVYSIPFPERHASWDIVDSRGLFESVTPDGDVPADTQAFMKEDIEEYQPDILLHVMTPDQIRAGEEDFKTVRSLKKEIGAFPPMVYCLNKVDVHMSPTDDWPPETNPSLSGDIKKSLDLASGVISEGSQLNKTPIEKNQPVRGYRFDSDDYIGVVPLYLKEQPYWNVETLSWLMGDLLPDDARLQFAQAQRRERLMRQMSRDLTNRFSTVAAGIGGTPSPGADIAVLTPMQLVLVGIIGSFSCRDLEWSTVQDYLGAMGGTTLAGLGARELARSMGQLIPGIGQAVSATVAAGTTWAIGRSAEEYFFNDNVVKPSELIGEGKSKFKGAK